ncbi:MAG: helix-turn-helix domain-containing protein, partial [Polyangiaceae bacterium]
CPIDTRIIAATHRDLQVMVSEGRFREDLFYRLDVITIAVPALRQRRDDIPMLVDYFLRMFAARYSRDKRSVSRQGMNALMAHEWPGNVRQLENVLLNAWILSDATELAPEDFELPRGSAIPHRPLHGVAPPSGTTVQSREEREKDEILQALEANAWNRAQAAKDLGIPRRTFYRRLKKYDIQ